MFTALSAASVLDDQNRLTIPQRLIERAGLEGKITFVGEGDRITLMRPERFEAEMAASLDNADFDVFLDTLQIPASGPNA
jgi:DNA-binding transcriptional regulator/RsmH inhibitor MraZ